MSSQPEQDPKKFSPRFEEAVQRQERIEARRNPPPRRRVRTKPCCIPECAASVHRANEFALCANHMMMVWHHVEGDHFVKSRAMEDWTTTRSTFADELLTTEEQGLRAAARRERTRRAAVTAGHLYVLDTKSGLIKIGWTENLDRRMREYPPTFVSIVTVPGTKADERDVHRSLKHALGMGREWYYVTPEVARQINEWIARTNIGRQQRWTDRDKAAEGLRQERRSEGLGPLPWSDEKPSAPPVMIPRFEVKAHHLTEVPAGKPAPKGRSAAHQVR